jgi:type IV pilus assembly protein PilE
VKTKRLQGFTLIEMMVTVAIIAILAAVALPNYQQYVVRSNRAAAQSAMMDIANRQQQLLLANRSYAAHDAAAWTSTGYTLPSEVGSKYTYTIVVNAAGAPPFYTITFTPISTGSQSSDGALTLASDGTKGPSGKW